VPTVTVSLFACGIFLGKKIIPWHVQQKTSKNLNAQQNSKQFDLHSPLSPFKNLLIQQNYV
jgi:hypothetical protein